jgi:hypothetical protein
LLASTVFVNFFAAAQAITPAERQRIMMAQDVRAVGNSGDKSFVPYLKDVLQSRKLDHQEWDDVQMALAKLGEREQQQQIVCIFYQGDKYEADRAGNRQGPYISGWFSSQLYMEMLDNKQIGSHWAKAKPQGITDEAMVSPVGMALTNCPSLCQACRPSIRRIGQNPNAFGLNISGNTKLS